MVEESSQSIKFPALGFNNGWIYMLGSMDDLSRSSRKAFKSQSYKHLLVVDSSGCSFHVESARQIRSLFNFSFGSLLGLLAGNPSLRVEFTFAPENPSTIPLDRIKTLILDGFKENEDYWDEMSDFEEFRDEIVMAGALDQVFAIFKKFHQL